MDEEYTNDPQFSHWEKRLIQQRTLTVSQGSSKGPFKTSGDSDLGDGQTLTSGTSYIMTVADESFFRVGHVFQVTIDLNSGASTATLRGIVTVVATGKITFKCVTTIALVDNGTTNENVGQEVTIIGSAFAQGRSGVNGEVSHLPVEFSNYTQIFRTPFRFTGTSLKTPLKYDESGPYKEKAKEHSVYHMIEMEKAFLFGEKKKLYTAADADPSTGAGLPTTLTGGLIYHLERWEAGDYGTVTASTDSDDDKRIIENSTGYITEKLYDTYLERLFRVTNNTSNEKLCLCGSGFLLVLNQLYRSKSVLSADLPLTDTYGMNVVKHLTPFGTIYYKTHPLFTQQTSLRNNALFLDVKNLKYRPMQGRDTELLKNRQENDADYRKDEWFTEAGFEMWFPESHLYMKNVLDFTP
jgi:hypothetical protein